MNKKEEKIVTYLREMNYETNVEAFLEFSSDEKQKLERLSERMHYLFNQLNNPSTVTRSKYSFIKDEFKALEWVLWEFGIIDQGYRANKFINKNSSIETEIVRLIL